jgi:CubicO group peptidase (beta-lactamase class C family)
MNQSLPRSSPEEQGVSSAAILDFLEAVQTAKLEFHSLMVLKHGHVIAEGWWKPYAPELQHMLFSLSKSFTSSAIGLLVDAGKINLDDTVISFFPDDLPLEISANLRAMKVKHLLYMATGHKDDPTNSSRIGESPNWIKTIFEFEVEFEPGTHFVYNSGATFLLSVIVQKITDRTLLEFLKPRVLEPLGIEHATWASNVQGINFGGWGLSLTTEDIAKFGQLYLQKGVWNGQQILSEVWVHQATSSQISNGDKPTSDWQQGYGYQFWRCQHGAYRGDGAFGQYCVVMPDQNAVVVITSAVNDMQQVLNLVWEHLLPGLSSSQALEPSDTAEILKQQLLNLELPVVQGDKTSAFAARGSGLNYGFEANEANIQSVNFTFLVDHLELKMTTNSGNHKLICGYGQWLENHTLFEPRAGFENLKLQKASLQGAWIASKVFELRICFNESAFTFTWRFEFANQALTLNSSINVGFGETVFELMNAKTQET